MASRRKSSSRKSSRSKKDVPREPSPLPPPVKTRKSYMRRWRDQRAAGYESEKWAKLELQLGRFAQGASLVCGFILGFTAFLASILSVTPSPPIIASFPRTDMALWFPLLATSFAVAGFTVAKKLGPYRRGYRSAHFLSSMVAFSVSIIFLAIALLDHLLLIDLGAVALWMYPASVLGLSLAFVSLGLTWQGFGWRKGASVAASLAVPASLILVPFVGLVDYRGLMLVYTYDALFIVFAGSLLHLIASSGDATQREILKASDTRMATLKNDMETKLKAIAYKEKAYVERETHLDAKERDLLDIEKELGTRGRELNDVQATLDKRGRELRDLEGRLTNMRGEVEGKVEELTLKETQVKSLRAQIEESKNAVAERERALADREKELKRAKIEAASRERGIQTKETQLADAEARLREEGAAINARRDEVIRLQKELELKESEVKLKIEQLEAQQSTEAKEKIKELKDWESKVLAKEREVGELDVKLRSMQEDLARQHAELEARTASMEKEGGALADREQDLLSREKQISDLEASLGEKGAEINRRWKELVESRKRVEAREGEYSARVKDAKMKEATFEATQGEIARKVASLEGREDQIKQWRANLEQETKKLQQKVREQLARERAVEAKESELSLKELEITTRDRSEAPRPAPAGDVADADRQRHLELWEKRLRGREEEFKRRAYQKEKEFEAREMAVREQIKAATPEGELPEAPVELGGEAGDRLRTGTARLDDLLYGGLRMNSNVLFVGPAFAGKEVSILNFVAEGLRTNAPTIIVTTMKPPVEIAKEMAPVLPTFMEYEQLGLVRWIDASGTTPTQKLTKDGNVYRVPNATDFEGILSAVNEADEDFRERGFSYFRFAFLTLSSALSQGDERTAIGFVQRFVNRLRQSKCIAAFALERGMHTNQQVEGLQQLMDGAIHFKQDKSKTLLSVVGLGEAQTRDWIPYKFTNKALMIGSFQLERIR